MAWTKNLGKVKGDTGDVYIPSVELDSEGFLHFTWTSQDTEEVIKSIKIPIPVYVPRKYEDGYITFTATSPIVDPTTNLPKQSEFQYYIKGDQGTPGPVHFYTTYTQASNPEDVENPQENTFYIANKKVWIYTSIDPLKYEYMEQFDFENYYTIDQTYSSDDIDAMLQSIEDQVELAQRLYDIDELVNN